MKSKILSNLHILCVCFLGMFISEGCKKVDTLTVPPAIAHFISSNPNINYYVRNAATDSFVVQVGTSDVSNVDRSVTFNVTSPTGAVNGTDYAITSPASGNAIVIKAGTAVSSITVKGKFAAFATGKKHTLYFTLALPSLTVAKFSDTVKLAMQRYCDVVPSAFIGVYKKAFDIQTGQPTYGPYTVNMPTSVATSAGATTGYVIISNFWDVGGADIRVNLDWTNPASFTTNVPAQFLYTDPTYGAATITGVGNGSFSSCDNTFSISYTVTVSAGSFGNFTTTIAR